MGKQFTIIVISRACLVGAGGGHGGKGWGWGVVEGESKSEPNDIYF